VDDADSPHIPPASSVDHYPATGADSAQGQLNPLTSLNGLCLDRRATLNGASMRKFSSIVVLLGILALFSATASPAQAWPGKGVLRKAKHGFWKGEHWVEKKPVVGPLIKSVHKRLDKEDRTYIPIFQKRF
jgi:hypothetical protein